MKVEAPKRVSRSYTQSIGAPPDEVFPLLCPVRETEWVNGWKPSLVLSSSGVAEPDCVFVTPGLPDNALWVMTVHEPRQHRLEMLKLIPEVVVGKIAIQLSADGAKGTRAEITYSYTALSAYGERALGEFSEEHFRSFMETWEREINHYLKTGKRLDLKVM
jgi:hypothetical protein